MNIKPNEVLFVQEALQFIYDSCETSIEWYNENLANVEDSQAKENGTIRLEMDKKRLEIVSRIIENLDNDILVFEDPEEIKAIVNAVGSYENVLETQTLDMLKEDCITEEELQENIENCTIACDILNRSGNKHDRREVKSFIEDIEHLKEPDQLNMALKRTEVAALLNLLNHVSDHESWVYEVMNGTALRSVYNKLQELSKAAVEYIPGEED